MPAIDIFNDDAFSAVSLTEAINEQEHVPQRIGSMGLFDEDGVTTTSVAIEKEGENLVLLPTRERGSVTGYESRERRKLTTINIPHVPHGDVIRADEIQNRRAFGSESELESVQSFVNNRLAKMVRKHEATLEHLRIGAIRGQIRDANGSDIIVDLFEEFDVTRKTVDFALGTATTKVKTKCTQTRRKVWDGLGDAAFTGMHVFCSASFFDALTTHANVEKAFERFQEGGMLRDDAYQGFAFCGMVFEEYRGRVGGVDFIPDGKAYAVPTGVIDLFPLSFAPADMVEFANTVGRPWYASQERLPHGKGISIHTEMNPLPLCTRPQAVVELSA